MKWGLSVNGHRVGRGGRGSAVKLSALSVALPPVGLKQGRLKMSLKPSQPSEHPGVVRFQIKINFKKKKSTHAHLPRSAHVRVHPCAQGNQKRAPGHLETEL